MKEADITISSYMMQLEFAMFEATDVAILVDTCYAGDFVDRFANHNGYLVMTSSDESHESKAWPNPKEGKFSRTFWIDLAIWSGHSAVDAFYNARLYWWFYYPQIVDNADYSFF